MEEINRGVIIEEVGVGAEAPYQVVLASGNWSTYRPSPEIQRSSRADFQCCETEAFLHGLEEYCNYAKANALFTDNQITKMRDLGFINSNNSFQFSVRFLAKLDGTTPSGNSNQKVFNGFVQHGVVGESAWPWNNDMTFNDYYAPIPQDVINKGQRIFDFIDVIGSLRWIALNKTRVNPETILYYLKQAPVQLSSPICPSYFANQNPVLTCNLNIPTHSLLLDGQDSKNNNLIWDSYPPYGKVFVNNYPYLYIAQSVFKVVPDKTVPPVVPINPTPQQEYSWHESLFRYFYRLFTGKDFS